MNQDGKAATSWREPSSRSRPSRIDAASVIACAMACARKGQPVGVLTSDAIYEITGDYAANNNAKLLDFVAKQVTVTGDVTEKDGKKLLNLKTIAMTK